MDPLSITASVSGLLGLGEHLFSSAFRYVRAVQGAKKDVTSFTTEVIELFRLLKDLEKIAPALEKRSDDSISGLKKALEDCKITLGALTQQLERANPAASEIKRLKWPFGASETKEMINELERRKSSISLAVELQSIMSSTRVENTQERHTAMLLQITESVYKLEQRDASTTLDQGTLQRINTQENDSISHTKPASIPETAVWEEEAKILEAFVQMAPQQTYEPFLELISPGTAKWIFQEPNFERWVLGLEKVLWVRGPPASGKTVLAASVVEHLTAKCLEAQSTAVAFFMCRANEDPSPKSLAVLSSFAAQLASQGERAQKRLTEFYHDEEMHIATSLAMSTDKLQDLVLSMCYDYKTVYLVIDGLDEWWNEVTDEAELLLDLSQHCRRIRIFFTSRNLLSFQVAFRSFSSIETEELTHNDLMLYINNEVERCFSLYSSQVKSRVKIRLLERSNGLFLWVKLVLQTAITPNDIDSEPMSLADVYQHTIDKLRNLDNPEIGGLIIACLTILAESDHHSISSSEVIAEAAIRIGMQDTSSLQVKDLVGLSNGMLTFDEKNDTFSLSHITGREYMRNIVPS